MYKKHSVFIQPPDEDIKVWRYMDFTKLVSLIDSRRLHFTRADKFDDPFEGSWPKMNVRAPNAKYDRDKEYQFVRGLKKPDEILKLWTRQIAISCWHMNEHESAAMWKLYMESNKGIAIQSTYNKLKRSMIDKETIYLGVVKYLDYEKEYIDFNPIIHRMSPFVHKRKSYEHEKEVRAIVYKEPIFEGGIGLDFLKDTIGNGVKIKVDLETLIEKVYISPGSPSWFAELVQSVIIKYGYNFDVSQSRLDEHPVF